MDKRINFCYNFNILYNFDILRSLLMKKIIIVDDEISALNTFLLQVVDNQNIECEFFRENYKGALEYVSENHTDAAFLDVRMPEIDGVTLAEKLVKISPTLQIVFITGYEQNEDEIRKKFPNGNLLGFIYKPYDPVQIRSLLSAIAPAKKDVFLRTFGRFELFIDGRAVYFSSSKAKELLALLTDAQGAYLSIEAAIDVLWEEKNAELGKRLYRDAVCRLRKTLKEEGIEDLVCFERGSCCVNTKNARCDLWEFNRGERTYTGSYMEQYGWSVLTEAVLEKKLKV